VNRDTLPGEKEKMGESNSPKLGCRPICPEKHNTAPSV